MERKCIECDTIIHGRIDKKYCSEYCRNGHNNKLNRDLNNLMRTTHNHLRKNYRVLQELIKTKSMIKIKKKHLINKGFNFDIHTHTKIMDPSIFISTIWDIYN